MRRLLLGLSVLAVGLPAAAAAPVTITAAKVFSAAPAGRTLAVVRPETGSAESDAALADGLRAAGLTVVAADARPDLLVSYVTQVRRVWGVFPNGNHAGTSIVPDSSVNDNYARSATVVAWDARSARPTAESVAWVTRLQSGGLSGQQRQFLPNMLRGGAAGYGRNLPPQRS